jgi:hypothetical protein
MNVSSLARSFFSLPRSLTYFFPNVRVAGRRSRYSGDIGKRLSLAHTPGPSRNRSRPTPEP